jgi:hypothetical protein
MSLVVQTGAYLAGLASVVALIGLAVLHAAQMLLGIG